MTKRVRSKRASVRLVEHARIVLLAADGVQNQEIAAQQLGVSRGKVARGRGRYTRRDGAGSKAICRGVRHR